MVCMALAVLLIEISGTASARQSIQSRPLAAFGLVMCALVMAFALTSNDWVRIGIGGQGGMLGVDRCEGIGAPCTHVAWSSLEHAGWIPTLAVALIIVGSAAIVG